MEMKKLGELLEVQSGFAFKSKDLSNDKCGIPVIKIGNLVGNEVDYSQTQFVDKSVVNDKVSRFFLENKDVLIAMTGQGSVGRVAQLRKESEEDILLLNQRVGKFTVKEEVLDNDYLFFVLSSKVYQEVLFSAGSGSGQPNLSPAIIKNIEIPYFDIKTQKKIGLLLTCLNDKIENNKRINRNLLEQLELVWLDIFDEIEPDIQLGDVLQTTSGGTPARKNNEYYDNGSIFWVKSKELQGSFIIETEEKITERAVEKSSAKILPAHSVLIAMYGATVGEYSILSKKMTCNQAVCAIIENEDYPYSYIYAVVRKSKEKLKNMAVGSAQQNISQVLIKQLLIHSDLALIKKYDSIAREKLKLIENNVKENSELSKMKYLLIPKLLSGELDVSHLEF